MQIVIHYEGLNFTLEITMRVSTAEIQKYNSDKGNVLVITAISSYIDTFLAPIQRNDQHRYTAHGLHT